MFMMNMIKKCFAANKNDVIIIDNAITREAKKESLLAWLKIGAVVMLERLSHVAVFRPYSNKHLLTSRP